MLNGFRTQGECLCGSMPLPYLSHLFGLREGCLLRLGFAAGGMLLGKPRPTCRRYPDRDISKTPTVTNLDVSVSGRVSFFDVTQSQ
jgi:hypothetical protein